MAVEIAHPRRRFTVDEYERMVEAGILGKEDRVELIHGEIIEMAPIGSRHAAAVMALTALFVRRLGDRALVHPAGSIRLPPASWPEPDLMLLLPRADFYRDLRLAPEHILLVVEVADATLRFDRQVKVPLYADGGLRETWVVDVGGEAVEVFREPSPGGYRTVRRVPRGEPFGPEAFPDLVLTVADILG